MKLPSLLFWLTDEFLLPMLIGSGIALIVGARRLAGTLITLVLVSAFAPVVVGALLPLIPTPLLLIAGVIVVIRLGFEVLGGIFGRRVTGVAAGHLLADLIKTLVQVPFLALRGLYRWIF